MAFDKKLYWERRKKGLRGQGDIPTPPPSEPPVTREDGSIISQKRNPIEYQERVTELKLKKASK